MMVRPAVTFVVPVYNRAPTLLRCVRSVLRQRDVASRVIVVDHGSTDGSAEVARELRDTYPEVELVELSRTPGEPKSPSRPLNEGLRSALRDLREAPEHTWVFRLDADDLLVSDDTIADQLRAGNYRQLIMATLVFFEPKTSSAYEYGPRPGHRSLQRLPGRDLFAVAHHATAMRLDLVRSALADGVLYDQTLETGEDLGATIRLLRRLGGDEHAFAFVDQPYCYKELDDNTITGSLALRRVWRSHRKLLNDCPELSRFAVLRGLAELALGRVVGERAARVSLQLLAGRNGHFRAVDFAAVTRRLEEHEEEVRG